MDPLCVRSPPATARADAVRVWGFTRWGFRAHRRAGTERGSVPLALPGRGCVLGDAGNDRAEHRRRSLFIAPPCGSAPRRGRPRWSRLRRFAVGAHGARSLRAKPAPRVRRLSHEQGNPPLRARFPWPAASSLRPRAPRTKTRASSRSSASSVRPSPFPRSCHGGCVRTRRASPPGRASRFPVATPRRHPARQETCHAGCEALRLSHGGGGPLFPAAARRKWGRRQKKSDRAKVWTPAALSL